MKRLKYLVTAALILSLVLGLGVTAAAATSYTVTFAGGKYGEDKGSVKVAAGSTIYPSSMAPQSDYDKFLFTGYHVAGQEGVRGAVTVNKDMVLVATYGMAGSLVQYTIHFKEYGTNKDLKDANGNSSITYYGNIGDKPVAAYVYIEGYEPQAYNITGTLVDGTNDWTLYYYPIVAAPTPTPVVVNGGGGGGGGGGANPQANPQNNANANQGAANEPDTNQPAVNEPQNNPQNNPAPATAAPAPAAPTAAPAPQEIIDIDDPDVPLAGPTTSEPTATPGPNTLDGKNEHNHKQAWIFGTIGGVALVSILAALWYAFLYRRRRDNDEDDE